MKPHPDEEKATGLPGLRSWRSVYLFVLGCFVTYVSALAILSRYFS